MEVAFVSSVTLDKGTSARASGIGIYIKTLTKELNKRNIPVTVITGTGNGGAEEGGSEVKKHSPKPLLTTYRASRKTVKSNTGFIFKLMLKMPSIKLGKGTIVHAQRPESLLPFIWFKRSYPRVCTLHGSSLKGVEVKHSGFYSAFYRRLEHYCLKRCAHIFAVDNVTRKEYMERYPNITPKIKVIPIGIDLMRFKLKDQEALRAEHDIPAGAKVLLYVGRLEREKRVDVLLRAFAELKAHKKSAGKDFQLLLVGDGRKRSELEGLVSELKLGGVRFMGALPHDKVADVMNTADVFVLCSAFEGSPTVIKEALACGLPVVATKVGDIPKIVTPGSTGELVAPDAKPREIAKAANKVIAMSASIDNLRDLCSKSVRSYGQDKVAEKLVGIYNEIR
jgi:glycosyltransferase involved in cell wall biosynthesis